MFAELVYRLEWKFYNSEDFTSERNNYCSLQEYINSLSNIELINLLAQMDETK